MEKENNTDESDFGENEIPDLNPLKPFEFGPKTNITDINSSQTQPSEVFCNKKCSLEIPQNSQENTCASDFNKDAGLSPTTLLKKRLWHRCFPVNFAILLRTRFFVEHVRTTASE